MPRIDGTGDLPVRWLRSRRPLQLIGTTLGNYSFSGRSRSGGVRLVGGSLGLSTEVGGGSTLAEEAADHRLEERVENDLGTAGLG